MSLAVYGGCHVCHRLSIGDVMCQAMEDVMCQVYRGWHVCHRLSMGMACHRLFLGDGMCATVCL